MVAMKRMDIITEGRCHITEHPLGCVCDACCYYRLKALRDCVKAGVVNEGEPLPGSRLHWVKWLYEWGYVTDWNVAPDPMPLPERLHRAWERAA